MTTFDSGQLSQWAVLLGVMEFSGQLQHINPAWQQLGWMPEQLLNSSYWDYVHPDDLSMSQDLLEQLQQGHETQLSFENRYQDTYAEYHWMLWTATLNPEHDKIHLAGVEVTRHKQHEALLREKNQLQQTILNHTHYGTLVYAANGKITFCNPQAARLLGIDSHELVGKSDWGLVLVYEDGSDFPANEHPALITLRLGRQVAPLTIGVYRQDTSFVWLSISSQPVWFKSGEDSPQPDLAVLTLQEITDTKYQIDEFRNKSTVLSAIFEQALLGIVVVDEEGRVIQINPAFCELVGYRADDLLGKPFTRLIPKALRAEAIKKHGAFLAGEIAEEDTWALQHADGRKLDHLQVSSICIAQQEQSLKVTFISPEPLLNDTVHLTQDGEAEYEHYATWLQFLFDNLPISLICLDRQGKLQFCQGKHIELLRIHSTDMQHSLLETHPHLAMFAKYIQRALAGEAFCKVIAYGKHSFKTHYSPLVEHNEWVGTQILFYEVTEELRLKNRLKNALYELESLTPHTPLGLMYVEGQRIMRTNQRCATLFGYTEAALLKVPLTELFASSEGLEHYQQAVVSAMRTAQQTPWQHQYWLKPKNGELLHCRVNIKLINKTGRTLWLIETIDKQETINQGDGLQKTLWQISQEALFIVDSNFYIQEANSASAEFTGYQTSELLGGSLPDLDTGRETKVFYENVLEQVAQEGFWRGEIWQRHQHGSVYQCVMTVSSYELQATAQNRRYLVALSQQKHSYNSLQDPLTGLASRALFEHKLLKLHAVAQRNSKYYALLMIAVDNMQSINQQYGYALGDEFLCKIAHTLSSSIRDSDIVARFAGDVFCVGLTEITQLQDADLVGKMMLFKLTQPISLSQGEIPCSVCIGVSAYPEDGNDITGILAAAQNALQTAKQKGSGRIHFFNPSLGKH